jgi:hypothetical protein
MPLAIVGVAGATTLLLGIPTVHHLHGWFWKLHGKTLHLGWLALTTLVVGSLVWYAYRARQRPWRACFAVFLVAVAGQFGLALADGRGSNAQRERAFFTGHGNFVRLAASGISARQVLSQYEDLVTAGEPYLAVKPPGQLLTYVALDRCAQQTVVPEALDDDAVWATLPARTRQLIVCISWLLPWLAACAVFPIAGLARGLCKGEHWLTATVLFALCAPFLLITFHLDQAVYPGLTAAMWWCALRAGAAPSAAARWLHAPAWGAAAGVLAWSARFLSFGLLPAVVLALCLVWATSGPDRLRRTVRFLCGAAVAVAVCWLTFQFWFGYDPVLRYARVMAAHGAWKSWSWTVGHVAHAAGINLMEFAWWANPTLMLAWVIALGSALRRLVSGASGRAHAVPTMLVACVGVVLVIMATLGRTFAETARLWLFMLPLVICTALPSLGAPTGRTFAVLCVLQWAWTVALKRAQDFL